MTRSEAARLAADQPLSFIRIGRSDGLLPADVSPYDQTVYDTARREFDRFRREGVLIQDERPAVYLYELVMDGRSQVGVVGCVHVDDYETDVIRKHERTRPDKEEDRTRHVLELNAHAEPVFLTFRDDPELDRLLAGGVREPPLYDFTAGDGVRHRVWRVGNPEEFVQAFARLPACYVADGHHRCACAWRAAGVRRQADPGHTGAEPYALFPAVLFPAGQVRILPYHRVVRDLGGLTPGRLLERLRDVGHVVPAHEPDPPRPGSVGVYLDGRWHLLVLPPVPPGTPTAEALDAARLERLVFGPLLGVEDIRTDPRVEFVGGIRGTAELERQVRAGEAMAAFALFPVTVDQLLAVADAGGIMPPKTTWFEPKLRSGLFVHTLD